MLRIRTVLGIVGAAAVMTVVGQPLAQRSLHAFVGSAVASPDTAHALRGVKGDRLVARTLHPSTRVAPVTVEIVGSSPLTLIMRARDGAVLYHVDGTSGTTSVARDGDLPAVTIRSEQGAPTAPVLAPSAQQAPALPAPVPSRIIRVGCEGAVSALVSAEARRMLPGRCLV